MKKEGPQINTMATYKIKVQGALDEEYAAQLQGLVIQAEATDSDEPPVTVLTGQLADQDALRRILNDLYDQRLPILALEYLEEDETQKWQALDDEDYLSESS